MRHDVRNYCARIGQEPLLVQGAGGNVSWKDGGTLWIKASGAWLADAEKDDIFVPADLDTLRVALARPPHLPLPEAPKGTPGGLRSRPSCTLSCRSESSFISTR